MSQIELSYEESKKKVVEEIQKHSRMYLATSQGDAVTVRRMGPIPDGMTIWFLTDVDSRKYKQMMENPNVALAAGDYLQIEGTVSLKGHPLDEENSGFIKIFKKNRPEMYERSSRPSRILQRPGSRLIEITPKRIAFSVWTPNYDQEPDFQPYTLILNTVNEKAYRISGPEDNVSGVYKTPAYKG